MKTLSIIAAVAFALLAGACSREQAQDGTAASSGSQQGAVLVDSAAEEAIPQQVALALTVALDLRANPGTSQAVLQAHGLTLRQFEELMTEIAVDPNMSSVYERELR